ncbi:MAG: class I SAM-dependent methyltransferase [Deltaproteobacteria bacterium]|nr:class I SAM-dependent methyltransferase [Deltaproteobacteria bacterium]
MRNSRAETAKYYDLNPEVPNDIPFYKARIPSRQARVLELGCGTGRVLLPLVDSCGYIHGIDLSQAMLSVCVERFKEAGIQPAKAQAEVGDITNFALGQRFDLIIAPFRVFQNLETDAEVDGLFRCVRTHLSPDGTCILNVFNPKMDAETMRREWCVEGEIFCWEVLVENGRMTCHDRRPRMDPEKLILYPELVYRRYEGNTLKDEVVLKIVMRCYYPEQFERLIIDHGFRVINRWGGYAGESYGQGPELVIQFTGRT